MNDATRCRVCQTDTHTFTDRQLKQVAHRCQACLAVFKDPQHFPTQAQEKARYDTHNNTLDSPGYVAFLNQFIDRAVIPFITHGRCLDYGCGPGPVCVHLLRERGFDAGGYDPIYAPSLSRFTQTYDLITCTEVLEHVFDPHAVFQTFQTVTHPGSIVAIMTLFVPESNADYQSWWYRRDETHVGFYHHLSFEVLALQYGFEIVLYQHPNLITLRRIADESIR